MKKYVNYSIYTFYWQKKCLLYGFNEKHNALETKLE
jgi:hypothetical protein